MRSAALALTSVLSSTLLLAACGAAPADDALFPLAEGRRWTYQVSTVVDEIDAAARETLVLANRGADSIDGAVSGRRRSSSGIEYWLRGDATGMKLRYGDK